MVSTKKVQFFPTRIPFSYNQKRGTGKDGSNAADNIYHN